MKTSVKYCCTTQFSDTSSSSRSPSPRESFVHVMLNLCGRGGRGRSRTLGRGRGRSRARNNQGRGSTLVAPSTHRQTRIAGLEEHISSLTFDEMRTTIRDIHSAQPSFLLSVLDHSNTCNGQAKPTTLVFLLLQSGDACGAGKCLLKQGTSELPLQVTDLNVRDR
ncbi:uncharacterized protein LOC144622478 [Crassostrea virginica]